MARYKSYNRSSQKKWDSGKKIDILEYSKNIDISSEELYKLSDSRVSTAIKILSAWHTEKSRLLLQKKEGSLNLQEIEVLQVLRQKTLDIAHEKMNFLQKLFSANISTDVREELDKIDRKISTLKVSTTGFRAFQSSTLEKWINQEELDKIANLVERLEKILPRLTQKRIEREEAKAIRERITAEKKQLEKAAAAAYFDKTRAQAESIKRQIRQQMVSFPNCPYCFQGLGDEPNADHIHPVSRGGFSTVENMVYICKNCNSKKYNLTLREFILRHHLDRDKIEIILDKMGKRF